MDFFLVDFAAGTEAIVVAECACIYPIEHLAFAGILVGAGVGVHGVQVVYLLNLSGEQVEKDDNFRHNKLIG
jgi:hypothetical protein